MDDLVHHCLRELSFDGDLGKYIYHVMSRGLAGCAVSHGLGFEPQPLLYFFSVGLSC